MDMFSQIITTFDHIVANGSEWSRDAVLDASSLMKCMLNFEFIVTLHTIERYIQVLTNAHTDVENQFHIIFDQASRQAAEYDV